MRLHKSHSQKISKSDNFELLGDKMVNNFVFFKRKINKFFVRLQNYCFISLNALKGL